MICIEIEERQGAQVEDIATAVMEHMIRIGDDILEHLDPPVGLRRWLEAKGLSLVETKDVSPPKVWEIIEDEEEDQAPSSALGGRESPTPSPQIVVGDYVEYQTAAAGPRGQSYIGSGQVIEVDEIEIAVSTGPNTTIYLDPKTDFIRPIRFASP